MLKFNIKNKLQRKEKRLKQKLWKWKNYIFILSFFVLIFSPTKKFITLTWRWIKKVLWTISISTYKVLWLKIWYIDEFIVNRKTRWKWIWTKLFSSTIDKLNREKHDYALLVSDNKRKASHKLYKKFWMTIISLWIWIIAYKKLRDKTK